jgi:hypothetical protein
MNRRLGALVIQASATLVGSWPLREAFAQGLPAPGPGGPSIPAAAGGHLMAPAIILAVAIMDMRRKRRTQAIAIEGQVADALMREPRLTGTVITATAHVPLSGRVGPTVEVRGEVEYPELRETVVRIVRQELLRHHPEGRVEDRIFVSPPVVADRR